MITKKNYVWLDYSNHNETCLHVLKKKWEQQKSSEKNQKHNITLL